LKPINGYLRLSTEKNVSFNKVMLGTVIELNRYASKHRVARIMVWILLLKAKVTICLVQKKIVCI